MPMMYFPVKSRPAFANSFAFCSYKICKSNPLHSQHLPDPLASADSKATSTPLDSAVTRPLFLTSLESALTKNRGWGVATPSRTAPKVPVSVSKSLSMGHLALHIAFALMLSPVPYPAFPASPQQSYTNVHQTFLQRLSDAAIERAKLSVRYDSAYVRIPYPNGDVPAGTGVCTDEVIRSYRALGVDLQKEVHEDMQRNFSAYPNQRRWMLAHTDTNIDHRRVPNLQVFFSRKGESLPVTSNESDYKPGELVTWDLGGNVPHIGIVVNKQSSAPGRYLVEHNIGAGPKIEDVLFSWKITGHYRYFGPGGAAAL